MKQTPLNAVHRAAGAKLVDFGGWEMPLHYGSQVEEHKHVREAAGLFDVSHMQAIDVNDATGDGARDFLRLSLSNDVDRLDVGQALYSCLLNYDGGIIDDLVAYRLTERDFRLVVNSGRAAHDLAWLQAKQSGSMRLIPRNDLAIIALQGPKSREILASAMPDTGAVANKLKPFTVAQSGDALVACTGYTGEDGFEIMLPANHAPRWWKTLVGLGAAPAGLGARDTLRLEAGMMLYGQDMDETVTPFEAGIVFSVHLGKGRDFIGRKALETRSPRHHSLGLALLDKGVLRNHQRVLTREGDGEITSGSFSPTLNRSIALARLPPSIAPGDAVEVVVRDRKLRAAVVKPPFVRLGKRVITVPI